ncbi:T9SS type A sorting domain-containing protein [Pontibacter sp. FD36]|uniref:T9SS type A sorting domain-containing protein n=1 Tax=Pontibacter sp. FD36 TaxID=2789860 RepID=UPI0018A977E0|nr:T9SS type A sorting domain-containing protein [Pontibacter sp. FD36]
MLTRDNPTVTLEGSVVNNSGQPIWLASDGGNFVSGYRTLNPIVDAPGTYTLKLQDGRGCSTEYTVKVTREEENTLAARIDYGSAKQLDCDRNAITLNAYVTLNGEEITEGITYSWTGPNSYYPQLQAVSVNEPGEHTVVATHIATGATATATLTVSRMPSPEGSAGPNKVLTAENPTVTLEGSLVEGSVISGLYEVRWDAIDGGEIVSGHWTFNPVVATPGTYRMSIMDRISKCTFREDVIVTREGEIPLVAFITSSNGSMLDCSRSYAINMTGHVRLNDQPASGNLSYQWAGPDGFSSNGKEIAVKVPGNYTLTVTDTIRNLSTTSEPFRVGTYDNPKGSAGPDKVLTSQNSTVTLEGSVSGGFSLQWVASDGGNIVSGERTLRPVVNAPGTYTIIITDTGGECKYEDSVVVTREEENILTAEIGFTNVPELDCAGSNSVTMIGFAYLNEEPIQERITYQWSGPNGYTADSKTVTVTEPGDYILVVTEIIGNLTATSSYTINPPVYPTGSAGPDKKLTCQNSTVTLEGSGDGAVIWLASHGGNIVSGERTFNPVVNTPGIYTMVVTNVKSGCKIESEVKVIREEALTVSAIGGQLDCTTGTIQLTGSSSAENATYTWTGPNGFISIEQNPVVKVAGTYTLTVSDKDSDCSGSTSVVVTPASTGVEITQHTIDFDSQPRGLISSINTEAGPVAITGRKRMPDGTFAPENYAAIFDSQDPTGDDTNLYTTDWGQVLIINQYQNNYPDATQWGGEIILDFSAVGPVTMESFRVVGVDNFEDMTWVYLYDADGKELNKVYLKPLGMNSKQLVNLGNTRGVMKMKVVLDGRDGSGDFAGSAAIDNIKFHRETATNTPCNTEVTNITHAKAYPTSFSERSKIEFIMRETDNYTISLYDTQGMLIKQLQTGTARAGELTTVEVHGQELKEGMYFARLVSEKGSHTFKLVLKR